MDTSHSLSAEPLLEPLPESELERWTERYAESATESQTLGVHFVVVRVGGERFAVALDDLDEVACVTTGIAVPHVSPLVLGLANIRGELLPLLDTGALLGVPARFRLDAANRTLVIRDHRGRRVGLPVEAVEAVEELSPECFQDVSGGDVSDLIRRDGLAEHQGKALARIDLTRLRVGSFSHF
jgi:chemotaxis signal transduction protein